MQFRTAVPADTEFLQKLFWELDSCSIAQQPEHFQRGERANAYLLSLIEDDTSDFIVCIEENEIIGFSLLFLKETKPLSLLVPCKFAYIQDFVITESRRRQGYGTLLMVESRKWAREHGADYLRLSVIPNNEAGIRFYLKNNFAPQMITMESPLHP